ncbi:MAG TPA: hypothetical protein VH163_04975 [Gemmatimonadales bacterium]|nr:hypothetical protein [Gemmatimonadales bacterium]
MVLGHFAVGFASKRAAPNASLGALMAAPLLADLLWPIFLLTGWEQVRIVPSGGPFGQLDFTSYPWSHSLEMGVVWGAVFGGLYWALTRYRAGAIVVFFGVVSHWVLDLVVHVPDLPLTVSGHARVGFGLWSSVPLTVTIEYVLLALGVWLYAKGTRARDGVGRWSFWVFVGLIAVFYAATLTSPPPASVTSLALMTLSLWLFPLWAWWFDRHRDPAAA